MTPAITVGVCPYEKQWPSNTFQSLFFFLHVICWGTMSSFAGEMVKHAGGPLLSAWKNCFVLCGQSFETDLQPCVQFSQTVMHIKRKVFSLSKFQLSFLNGFWGEPTKLNSTSQYGWSHLSQGILFKRINHSKHILITCISPPRVQYTCWLPWKNSVSDNVFKAEKNCKNTINKCKMLLQHTWAPCYRKEERIGLIISHTDMQCSHSSIDSLGGWHGEKRLRWNYLNKCCLLEWIRRFIQKK